MKGTKVLTLRAQLGTHSENMSSYDNVHKYAHVWITTTVEPPIKDTPNKGHLFIKDKTPFIIFPTYVSYIWRFHCIIIAG